MTSYEQLIITCQTNSDIPPPYEHFYILSVTENPVYLTLSYKQEYTGREGISEEDLLDEGFTTNDNFDWSGSLNTVWKKQLEALYEQSKKLPAPPDTNEDYVIELKSISKEGNEVISYVADRDIQKWTYLLQELKQAIYEVEKYEAPMMIKYLSITEKGSKFATLKGSFAERSFTVRVDDSPIESFDWGKLQEVVRMIFLNTEIDEEQEIKGTPTKSGKYILLPESNWFELGKAVIDINPKGKTVQKIINTLESLTGN